MSVDPAMLTSVFADPGLTSRRLRRSRVTVVSGPNKGAELVVDRERVTVGRSVICDLVLSDKAVSGTHCELVADEKGAGLKTWQLDEDSAAIIVTDTRGTVLYFKQGAMSAAEVDSTIELIKQQLAAKSS